MIGTPPPSEVPRPLLSDFEELVDGAPIHARDRVPPWILRVQGWLFDALPYERRSRLALVVMISALLLAAAIAGARLLLELAAALDIFAFAGLFVVNWLGNGGALVPIPGARIIGLALIFQQAVVSPAVEVVVIGGAAMALGLLSYYLAGARSADHYARGDKAGAEAVVGDSSILTTTHATAAEESAGESAGRGLKARLSASWKHAQARAQPVLEKRGTAGMFWLCFVPSPAATAAAFVGGALGFGFKRFLLASFASKYALAGLIVLAALVLSAGARSIDLPF